MTTYRQTITQVDAPQLPQLGPLVGGKIAKGSRVLGVFRGQSKTLALGRRIVAAQSMRGDSVWFVPDTNPNSMSITHPTPTSSRTVMRGRFDLSPGHMLRISVVYIPSGQTQVDSGGGNYIGGGAGGLVRVDATWYDQAGSSETSYKTIGLEGSELFDGAAPTGQAAWSAVRVAGESLTPPAFLATDDVARWSEHAAVDLQISHAAGARVLDVVVSEVPVAFARAHDDAADQQVSGLYGDPDPNAPGPTISHPVERIAADDPRGGTLHTLTVPQAQRVRLGPHLVSWSAWSDDAASVGASAAAVGTTSSSFVRLWDGASVGYDEDEPGWSISCAAYARAYAENHPYFAAELGTTPVLVAVYGGGDLSGNAAASGIVRVQANAWTWIDVAVTGQSAGNPPQWFYAYGHLRVGKGPGDPSIVQAFFRRSSGTPAFQVQAVSIFAAGQRAEPF